MRERNTATIPDSVDINGCLAIGSDWTPNQDRRPRPREGPSDVMSLLSVMYPGTPDFALSCPIQRVPGTCCCHPGPPVSFPLCRNKRATVSSHIFQEPPSQPPDANNLLRHCPLGPEEAQNNLHLESSKRYLPASVIKGRNTNLFFFRLDLPFCGQLTFHQPCGPPSPPRLFAISLGFVSDVDSEFAEPRLLRPRIVHSLP